MEKKRCLCGMWPEEAYGRTCPSCFKEGTWVVVAPTVDFPTAIMVIVDEDDEEGKFVVEIPEVFREEMTGYMIVSVHHDDIVAVLPDHLVEKIRNLPQAV